MTRFLTAVCVALLALITNAYAQSAILQKSNAVITGFPGAVVHRDFNKNSRKVDETVIDLNGASVRIKSLFNPGFVWDGRTWQAPQPVTISARKVGLVFGVAIDNEPYPNAYFTATSAFGLHLTAKDNDQDGHRERITTGQPNAKFMAGQWGNGQLSGQPAGAGSIWKLDGKTGKISLFANITLNNTANSGAGLGNISYDNKHKQLIVSDRNTGMIHILDLSGNELDVFDHGTTARTAAGLSPVPFDPTNRLDITSDDFDTEDPDTWGFATPRRRPWGLATHNERLYYAVARGETSRQPQIWSVGIDPKTGRFSNDPRWELDVAKDASTNEISDIVFTKQGAMILAQRGKQLAKYDFSQFTKPKKSGVLRYWLENPDNRDTQSRWIAQPEEYAVGFRPDHRNGNGGIALGYGYTKNGRVNSKVCQASLWNTGDNLRNNALLEKRLSKGGPTNVSGIQGSPTRPVRNFNTPPWASYFVDFDGNFSATAKSGEMGDIEIFTPDCYAEKARTTGKDREPFYTAWNYPESDDWTYPEDVPPSCTWANGCISGPAPEFDVKKTCNYCQTDAKTGKLKCQCQIKVTSNGVPFIGPFSISDGLSIGNGTITAISSSAPWTCNTVPTAQCSITAAGLASVNNSSTINVDVVFDNVKNMETAKNCASGASTDSYGQLSETKESCTTFGGVKVEKKMKSEHCQFGALCSYEITVTNLSSTNPFNAPVNIVDQMTGATMTITSITPAMCNPEPTQAPFACIANVNLAPGAAITYTITGMQIPTGGFGTGTVEVSNCASTAPPPEKTSGEWWADFINGTPSNQSCAKHKACAFSCHMSNTSDLAVKKELKSANCKPGGLCTYTITMTNTGTASRNGPFSLVDDMPVGASLISVTGLPWTCAPNAVTASNDLVCKYPPSIPLAGGASISFDVTISIPASFSGTEIKNCVGFDLKPLSGSEAKVGRQIEKLPTLQSTKSRSSNPQANLARYFINRGLGDAQSQKLAQKVFKQAISGDLATDREKSCVTVPVSDTPDDQTDNTDTPVQPPKMEIVKTCLPVKRDPDTNANDANISCTIEITGTNLQPGGTIQLTELAKVIGNTASISSASAIVPPLACGNMPVPADTAVNCSLTSDALINAGGTLTLDVTVSSINPNWLKAGHGQNCASASYTSSNATVTEAPESCAKYTLKPEATKTIPPIVSVPRCDKRTTYKKGNACQCRFGRAKKISPTACACPRGTKLNAERGRCQKVLRCIKPAKLSRRGTSCLCPRGWRPNGRNGCRKTIICKKPARANRKGTACYCPRGWRPDGRNGCRKKVIRLCVPPARPIVGARGCHCPRGWRRTSPFSCGRIRAPRDNPRPKGDKPRDGGFVIKPFG